MTTLQVRPYQPGDAVALPGLVAELGYQATPSEVEERLARLLAAPGQAVFVAATAGKIVGLAHVQEHPALHTPQTAELTAIVVTRSHRGIRVGRALVQAAEQWAHGRGCVLLQLRSNVARHEAHRFYERLGYVNASTSYKFTRRLA